MLEKIKKGKETYDMDVTIQKMIIMEMHWLIRKLSVKERKNNTKKCIIK